MKYRKRVTITPELAHTMRRLHDDGVKRNDIATRTGLSASTVRRYTVGESKARFHEAEPVNGENEQLILELADESGVHIATREELQKFISEANKRFTHIGLSLADINSRLNHHKEVLKIVSMQYPTPVKPLYMWLASYAVVSVTLIAGAYALQYFFGGV